MTTSATTSLQARARSLARLELEYQFHESFHERSAGKFLLDLDGTSSKPTSAVPAGLPAHLARLCERPLLTAKEEQHRFRRMNYAKYKAQRLCRRLPSRRVHAAVVQRIEKLLALARSDRDAIVCANTRLAISITKRYAGWISTFDELLSEAMETLIRAVDKFDFSRGFRFSTYATTAITRSLQRSLRQATRQRRDILDFDFAELAAANTDVAEEYARKEWDVRRQLLLQLVRKLDPRESFILTGRFGLGAPGHCRTLSSLAKELGVCKERVRQLEMRATEKLRHLYEHSLDGATNEML